MIELTLLGKMFLSKILLQNIKCDSYNAQWKFATFSKPTNDEENVLKQGNES